MNTLSKLTRSQKRNMRRSRNARRKAIQRLNEKNQRAAFGFVLKDNTVPTHLYSDLVFAAKDNVAPNVVPVDALFERVHPLSYAESKTPLDFFNDLDRLEAAINGKVDVNPLEALHDVMYNHRRNEDLPVAPQPRTTSDPLVTKAKPKNRRERREEYENSPEVREHYARIESQRKRAAQIRKIISDPQKGLYLSSDPEVKFAECRRCGKRYEILKGSPLLKEETQIVRDDGYGEWWILDPDNECPDCSSSHKSLGWCCITDSMMSDSDDDDIHKKEIKDGKRSGKEVVAEYVRDGRLLFGYNWGYGRNMCRCTNCIRTFELGKYDHELKLGENIQRFLRDPEEPLYKPSVSRHGISFYY